MGDSTAKTDGTTEIFATTLQTSGSRFHNSFMLTKWCILFKIHVVRGVVTQVYQARVWKSGSGDQTQAVRFAWQILVPAEPSHQPKSKAGIPG